MKAICAINNLGYIGNKEGMVWHNKADLQHFKKMTENSYLIVGRKTFELLPSIIATEKDNRTLCVITNNEEDQSYLNKNRKLTTAPTISEIKVGSKFGWAGEQYSIDLNNTWVIGGLSIYKQLLPYCSELHISHINNNAIGTVKWLEEFNFNGKIFNYYF